MVKYNYSLQEVRQLVLMLGLVFRIGVQAVLTYKMIFGR